MIAKDMQRNGALRQRLTGLCYVGPKEQDPIGRVTRAWRQLLSLEPIYRKVNTAIKAQRIQHQLTLRETWQLAQQHNVITETEYRQLMEAEHARDNAMNVDEFAFDELLRFNADRL